MARGSVYLIGSGQGGVVSTVVKRALEGPRAAGHRPRVAASYAAMHGDGRGLAFMVKTAAKMFGVDVERLLVPGEQGCTSDTEGRKVLEGADVVFLAGGDPVAGAELFTASGADGWLREARERGVTFVGISAGSMMLCEYWARWPDEGGNGAPFEGGTLVRCAGAVPDLVVDCHAEEDGWSELAIVDEMLREKALAPRLLGIPTGAAIVVDAEGEIEHLGHPPFRLP